MSIKDKMNQAYSIIAPGARLVIRDAEWIVRRVDKTSTGGQALHVIGISELVKDKEAIFLDEIEKKIETLDPAETKLVQDNSSSYQASLLYIESLLRKTPPTDENLYIGHKGAMDSVPYQLDAKKIWTVLSKQRPVFAIFHSDRKSTDQDAEAQSPLKSAVDEAIKEKQVELDDIAEHVKNQVEKIAHATVEKLREMDEELAQELNPRFSKPNWAKVFSISLTDDEQIPINKRGSGVRRLILLNFFRAKAESRLEQKDAPGVIYAIEEPETSQHPNNQKLLVSALRELSEQPGCQVIITTHTPVLVKDLSVESLRYIQKTNDFRQVFAYNEATYNRVAKALGIIPDHDVKVFIGLEGVNDIDFMKNISKMLIDNGENVIELTSLEDNGKLIFIPLGGSSLSLWTHRFAGLNRFEFHLYDRDDAPPATSRHQDAVDQFNERDNSTAMLTGKREMENYIHSDAIIDSLGVTIIVDNFCDVPDLVAEQLHIANGGQVAWDDLDSDKKKKKISRAKRRLNNEVLESMTVERLNFIDQDNDVRAWLSEIKRLYEV